MNSDLIVGCILSAVGAIASSYVWERQIRDRVYAKRVTSASDKDIEGMINLYSYLFPDNTIDYSAEEIRELFEKQEEPDGFRHVKAEDILLVAKFKGAVAGFLFCHYYHQRKKAIISYFAIDKEILEARQFAAAVLLKHLSRLLARKFKQCEYLFFDVARPEQQLTKDENDERKARINRFMQSARTIGKRAYGFEFDYHSPRVSLAGDTHVRPLVLMFIPLKGPIPLVMQKNDVVSILQFIFCDCYGDIYRVDDSRFIEYQGHLAQQVKDFERFLPDQIPLFCDFRSTEYSRRNFKKVMKTAAVRHEK